MKLLSAAFKNNSYIPPAYTCEGKDINPPLKIEGVPKSARTLALVVDDPDALNGDWVHWTVWNIDPNTQNIDENKIPIGAVEGRTSFGHAGYGGPCPPQGVHHYQFKLYALNEYLLLSSSASKEDLFRIMEGHVIDSAELTGLYTRE